LWDHAEFLLVLKDLIAERVPTLVEEVHVANLLDRFGRRVVRRVGTSGVIVEEERHRGMPRGELQRVVRE
jgi:hypothetical protein